ncbi:MAG: MFS transporter [Deltaproteobacteria bacterium]|nr:MFS transporter [Deltaproteobacteria bacterium]
MFFVSAFAFFAAGYTLVPTLPLILHDRGATPAQVGLVMGAFTGASLLLRAPVGRILARESPLPLLRWGQLALGLGFAAYFVPGGLWSPLAGRVIQGIGFAAFNTAAYVYLAELAGPSRRAEYMSLLGLSANVAMGLAPAVGSLLLGRVGETGLFTAGAAACGLSLLCLPRGRVAPAAGGRAAWFDPLAWRPAAAMLGLALAYGTVMVFVPLAIRGAGLSGGWLFFTVYAAAIITTRLSTRRALDRGGRRKWIFGGSATVAVAVGLLALSSTWPLFLAAAVLFGAGVGTSHPTLMAYILECVPPERRSAAAAMATSAFDAGLAGGAALAGWLAGSFSYSVSFASAAVLLVVLFSPLALGPAQAAALAPGTPGTSSLT